MTVSTTRVAKWRAKNKGQFRTQAAAHAAVRSALASGRLTKLPCQSCGTTSGVHAHHEDYSQFKRLDVIWLCVQCHQRLHAGTHGVRERLGI